jgi:hypothetical protein
MLGAEEPQHPQLPVLGLSSRSHDASTMRRSTLYVTGK